MPSGESERSAAFWLQTVQSCIESPSLRSAAESWNDSIASDNWRLQIRHTGDPERTVELGHGSDLSPPLCLNGGLWQCEIASSDDTLCKAWELVFAHFARQAEEAWIDPLTGLPNRARLNAELTWRKSTWLGFIDVDGLGAINRERGFPEGDRVLCLIAERLKSLVQPEDCLCRIGGDEFVLLSSRRDRYDSATVREACREAVFKVSIGWGSDLAEADADMRRGRVR